MDRSEQMVIIGEIAADQWGLVTAKQAAAQGVNGVQLMRLTEASLLERVGRGVYLVPAAGYPTHLEIKVAWLRLAPEKLAWQREATDPDSGVISHASACLLHELGDIPAAHVEITVPRRRVTRESDVRLPVAQLDPADITLIDGLPVTTPERTIVDLLRAHIDAGHIGGVIADADHRSLISVDVLADRVQPFAKSYGLAPSTDGSLLIDHLVAQAGTQLREDDAKRAAAAAYTYGAADTFRRLNLPAVIEPNPVLSPTVLKILDSSLADREANLARMLAPLNEEATAAIARMAAPAAEMQAAIARMLAPLAEQLRANNEEATAAIARMAAPAAEMQAAIARMLAPLAEQLRASTGDVTLDRMLRADLRAAAQDRLGTDTAEDPQPPALPPATAERPQHEGESEAKDQPN